MANRNPITQSGPAPASREQAVGQSQSTAWRQNVDILYDHLGAAIDFLRVAAKAIGSAEKRDEQDNIMFAIKLADEAQDLCKRFLARFKKLAKADCGVNWIDDPGISGYAAYGIAAFAHGAVNTLEKYDGWAACPGCIYGASNLRRAIDSLEAAISELDELSLDLHNPQVSQRSREAVRIASAAP